MKTYTCKRLKKFDGKARNNNQLTNKNKIAQSIWCAASRHRKKENTFCWFFNYQTTK